MKRTKLVVGAVLGILFAAVAIGILDGGVLSQRGTDKVLAGQSKKTITTSQKKANQKGSNLTNIWSDGGYMAKGCYTGNNYYYAIYNKIYKLNLLTNKKTLIKKLDCFNVPQVIYNGNTLYFIEDEYAGTAGSYPYISKMSINGTNYKRLCAGSSISIAGDRIYFMSVNPVKDQEGFWSNTGIASMSFSGKSMKTILKSSDVTNVICDGKNIYYQTTSGMYRMDLLGKVNQKVANGSWDVVGLYKNQLYYVTFNDKTQVCSLYKKNLANGKRTRVCKSVNEGSVKINVENGKLYYANEITYTKKAPIYEMNLKTGKTKAIINVKHLYGLSIYGDCISYNYSAKDNLVATKVYNMKTKKTVNLGTYYVS